ncbi:hypothetical protein L1887_60171 [Cichorium endivia]|nr:hypothetical protein L1887_60171 [Cichorium endivia]
MMCVAAAARAVHWWPGAVSCRCWMRRSGWRRSRRRTAAAGTSCCVAVAMLAEVADCSGDERPEGRGHGRTTTAMWSTSCKPDSEYRCWWWVGGKSDDLDELDGASGSTLSSDECGSGHDGISRLAAPAAAQHVRAQRAASAGQASTVLSCARICKRTHAAACRSTLSCAGEAALKISQHLASVAPVSPVSAAFFWQQRVEARMLAAYPSDVSVCPFSAAIVAEGAEIETKFAVALKSKLAGSPAKHCPRPLPVALEHQPPHLQHEGGCRGCTSRVKLLQ